MDEKLQVLTSNYARAPNMLCVEGGLESALYLSRNKSRRFAPLHDRDTENGLIAEGLEYIFNDDREYSCIRNFFDCQDSPIFDSTTRTGPDQKAVSLLHHYLLNTRVSKEDILMRQETVRELIGNKPLYSNVENILSTTYLYTGFRGYVRNRLSMKIELTPEEMGAFLGKIMDLSKYHPKSLALNRLIEWADETSKDTLFREILTQKRKSADGRLIAFFSERFNKTMYGVLKPGVSLDQFVDALSPQMTSHVIEKKNRRGKTIRETRSVVKYKTNDDKELISFALFHGRQRMDNLNLSAVKAFSIPVLLAQIQMKHYFQGAFLYNKFLGQGYSMIYPELSETNELEVKKLYPLRLMLDDNVRDQKNPKAPSNFKFSNNHMIVQAEGPNNRGKSEAWRTIHLLNGFINAGYLVPADYVRSGVIPRSHFISCKENSGHGGSEFSRSTIHIVEQLHQVFAGDQVIFDEFGDATNAPTALEAAKQAFPVLLGKGCRVYVTTHHDALTDYVVNELAGLSLTPNSKAKGVNKFSLVISKGKIDFMPKETVHNMGFTNDKIERIIKDKRRVLNEAHKVENNSEDDYPF